MTGDATKPLLSTVRASWTEKDLIPEMADMHQRTIKRWWKKLNVPPDKGRRPNCWSQSAAEKLVCAWRNWWTSSGHNPDLTGKKFSGALTGEPDQLPLTFNGQEKFLPNWHIQKGQAQSSGQKKVTAKKSGRCRAKNAASAAGDKKAI